MFELSTVGVRVYESDGFCFSSLDELLIGYFYDNTVEAVHAVSFQHSFVASSLFGCFESIVAMS